MDPISAAGIGLSAVSLALQVFSGCIKGYQILGDAADLPKTYLHLRTRLRIEQSRHLNWGEQIGLLEESLDLPSQVLRLHRNLILDVLLEVSAAFASVLKIAGNYDDLVPDRWQVSNAASAKQARFLQRVKNSWKQPAKVVARLQWATIKQDRFEALILRLVSYNDAMESILDRSSLQDLYLMQERSNLILLQLTKDIGELRTLTKASQLTTSASSAVATVPFPSIVPASPSQTDRHLASLAAFKVVNLTSDNSHATEAMLIKLEDLGFLDGLAGDERCKAKMGARQVYVEWTTPLESTITAEIQKTIVSRLSSLAALLGRQDQPPEFRCARGIGYCQRLYDDEIQYGLVYEAPSTSVATLRDCYNQIRSPSLTVRINLAKVLIESLLYLHAVNWLHKGFRSDNVLFTYDEKNDGYVEPALSDPLISGFDFSRPDTSDEETVKSTSQARRDYYKHPDLLQHTNARSQKSYDIYALGIVLVEIALWRPVEVIMASILQKPLTTSQIPKVRDRLLNAPFEQHSNVMAAVASQTGEIYSLLVKRCIEGGASLGLENTRSDQADPSVSADLQRAFYDDVYLRIKSICI